MKTKFKIKFLSRVEKDYFESLNEIEQKKIIKKMYKLEKIKDDTIPFRFKILSLYTTDYNKNILLDLYNNFCNLDKTFSSSCIVLIASVHSFRFACSLGSSSSILRRYWLT